MKTTIRISLTNTLFPLWLILCVIFFISVPGQVSYIHWSTLKDILLLPMKLGRINGWVFIKDIILSFAGIAVFTLSNLSMGFAILRLIKIEMGPEQTVSLSARTAFLGTAFVVGHGVLSLIFMTLALQGWLTPFIVGTFLLAGFLAGFGMAKRTFLSCLKMEGILEELSSKRERAFLALGIIIVFLGLLSSSARLSYDSVAVYFSDARITAMMGRMQYFTNDSFVVSTFQTAIQFSVVSQLFGDQAARLFSWVNGIVIIIFSLAIAEQAGLSKHARVYLFLVLVTSTAFIDLLGDGKVELASFSPVLAAIYWIQIESHYNTPHKSLLVLIGILLGLAMVARPYNIVLVGGFAGLYYIQSVFPDKGKVTLRSIKRLVDSLFWIGTGVLGVGIYHLGVNWVLLGSPLAMLSNAVNIAPSKWQWSIDPKQLFLIRILYPFAITYLNTPQSLGTISPLFIGFFPALLIKDVRERIIISRNLYILSIVSVIVLLAWVFMFFTVMEIRYALFLWIILFMPLSEIIARTMENGTGIIRQIVTLVTFLLLGFIAFRSLFISIDTYSPIDAQGNPKCNDSRFCEYLKSINEAAAPGDRVLTLGAFRYYLRNDLFACSTRNTEYKTLQELTSQNPGAFWEEVYRQGYKYIAYENDYTTRHLQFAIIPSPSNTPEWIELEPIFGVPGDLQVAYKINVSNPPVEVEATCQKDSPKGWEIRAPVP
jgi:hypothetical protein